MKCFYIINSAGGTSHEYNWHIYGLPAWQIARYYKTFSINGYSGNKPANFHALDPLAPGYSREIGTWIAQYNLTGVWALDIATGRYVYFLDSDDFLELDTLSDLCAKADEEKLAVT